MQMNRWGKPIIVERNGMRIILASAEEGMNWLAHQPSQESDIWQHAWHTCRAVHEGRLPAGEGRSAVLLVTTSRH
jgi:hypothetical protein